MCGFVSLDQGLLYHHDTDFILVMFVFQRLKKDVEKNVVFEV